MGSPTLSMATRPYRKSDEPFLFHAWLRTFRKSAFTKHLPNDVYYQEQHRLIEKLLSSSETTMAVAPENEDTLYGYITVQRLAGDPCVLHFAYVKQEHRRKQVFARLAKAAGLNLRSGFFYTHAPPMTGQLVRKFPAAVYRRDVLELIR